MGSILLNSTVLGEVGLLALGSDGQFCSRWSIAPTMFSLLFAVLGESGKGVVLSKDGGFALALLAFSCLTCFGDGGHCASWLLACCEEGLQALLAFFPWSAACLASFCGGP